MSKLLNKKLDTEPILWCSLGSSFWSTHVSDDVNLLLNTCRAFDFTIIAAETKFCVIMDYQSQKLSQILSDVSSLIAYK